MMQMQNYILNLKGESRRRIIKVFIWAHRENMVITSHPATQPTGYHYHWMHRSSFTSSETVFLQKPFCTASTFEKCANRAAAIPNRTVNLIFQRSTQNPRAKPRPWVLAEVRLHSLRVQGWRTWYLCTCLRSQYCILFRLPSGGTVS